MWHCRKHGEHHKNTDGNTDRSKRNSTQRRRRNSRCRREQWFQKRPTSIGLALTSKRKKHRKSCLAQVIVARYAHLEAPLIVLGGSSADGLVQPPVVRPPAFVWRPRRPQPPPPPPNERWWRLVEIQSYGCIQWLPVLASSKTHWGDSLLPVGCVPMDDLTVGSVERRFVSDAFPNLSSLLKLRIPLSHYRFFCFPDAGSCCCGTRQWSR